MSLRTTYSPPQSPWEGLQAINFDQCLHTVKLIEKCTDVFRGIFWLGGGGVVEKRGICWGNFPWSNFPFRKKIAMKGVQDFLVLFKKKTKKK